MKKFLLLSFMLTFAFAFSDSWAQERTVSGKVTSIEDGSTLPGVNVVLKGTTIGTVTDIDGNFKLSVPSDGGTLVFSFIGLASEEIAVGARSVIDVSMSPDVQQLSEVIVTAQGIQKEKKALGYAVSTVSAESLNQKAETDLGRVLRGQAAGVNITQTSGTAGSATNIIIRGYTSINGSNQPLFIVDGVPFNSETTYNDDFVDGQTAGSRFNDLDPNNIESVNVLKGLSATVLYGERGRNGVILITTKNGNTKNNKKGLEVSVGQSVFASEIASLPDYQDNYGGGFFQNFGFFFSNWGPNFNEIESVNHPYGSFNDAELQAAFPEFVGQQYPYQAFDNTDFWRTGITAQTTVNISGGGENASFNLNYGFTDDEGFTPGNEFIRHNFGFGGNAKLSNNFEVGGSFNFTRNDYSTPPIAASAGSGSFGSGSSIFGDVFYTPRNIDLMGLPFENPITGGSVYYRSGNDIQNPRWTVKNAFSDQQTDRFFGSTFLKYNITDNINFTYRLGLDFTNEDNRRGQNKGGVDGPVLGTYSTETNRTTIWNHDFILSGSFDLNEDFNLDAVIGVQGRRDEFYSAGAVSNQQVVFGVFDHFNFETAVGTQFIENENYIGLYGQTMLSFREYLYLTLSGRNDWQNTAESGNNSLLYPGASLAFDATTAIPSLQNSSVLSYLKIRAAYGSSANFPDPYSTRNTLGLNARQFFQRDGTNIITNTVANRLGNPDLTPERLQEFELGIETQLFDNKVGLNISVYQKTTTDLILDQFLDPSTGYDITQVNAGELQVEGLEIEFNANPVTIGDFRWNVVGNFTADETTVIDLPEGNDEIVYAGFTNQGNFAIEGQPLGIMQGSVIARTDDGTPIIDSQGFYVEDPEIGVIGNPQPDWFATIMNSFSWKGLTLGVEFQYRHGGDIFSTTTNTLLGRGITTDTDFDRRRSFVLQGVQQAGVNADGSPIFVQNREQIAATNYYFDVIGVAAPDELYVRDGTTIRLEEVSLSYSLPQSILSKTPFGSATITAQGFNLWYDAVNFPDGVNFDTNVLGTGVGNGQGFEYLNSPSVKRYGATLRLTF